MPTDITERDEDIMKFLRTLETRQGYTRAIVDDVEVRAVDEDKRQATFVAATEGGVRTWLGKQHLRMAGANLDRYKRNNVILDTHDRSSASKVIGSAVVKREKRQLVAVVTFAKTELAETIWQLVQDGFVRAVSVGFIPERIKTLEEGETDGRGESKIEGPAEVVLEWELYEISVVPVGADEDALRLNAMAPDVLGRLAELMGRREEPAQSTKEVETMNENETQEHTEQAADVQEVAAPVEANEKVLLHQTIRSLAPEGMRAIADELINKGATEAEARRRFLSELEARTEAIGTPEPLAPKAEGGKDKERTANDLEDRDFVEAVCG